MSMKVTLQYTDKNEISIHNIPKTDKIWKVATNKRTLKTDRGDKFTVGTVMIGEVELTIFSDHT